MYSVPIKHKSLLTICAIGISIVIILYVASQSQDIRSKASLTGPSLQLVTTSRAVAKDENTTVQVLIDSMTRPITAAYVDLVYTPTTVKVLTVSYGTLLPVILTPITTSNGNIRLAVGAKLGAPFSGKGILATITVQNSSSSDVVLSFGKDSALASLDSTTNILATTAGAKITMLRTPTPLRVYIPRISTKPVPSISATITQIVTQIPEPYVELTPFPTIAQYEETPLPSIPQEYSPFGQRQSKPQSVGIFSAIIQLFISFFRSLAQLF